MKKIFALLLCFGLLSSASFAQIADGSIAPNFTATDIEGNEHTLYDVLDQGKSVILDISATWCGPCWGYHEEGTLEDLYSLYGPDGTDEMMVFMIEGDESTNTDCLYDLPGCSGITLGDWTAGVDYPIIDNHEIAEDFEITFFPSIFHICPNRIVTLVGPESIGVLYAQNDACATVQGADNVGILSYDGFSGNFCGELEHSPSVTVQNLGTNDMSSASIELLINGTLVETLPWSGSLSTFQTEIVTFSSIVTIEDSEIEVRIASVNGVDDEDDMNNSVTSNILIAPIYTDNLLTVEIMTDTYPGEIFWELRSNGILYYSGGNETVISATPTDTQGYSLPSTLYLHELVLPGDECYDFTIYDSFGDGISGGYYRVLDSDGTILFEGIEFGDEDSNPFGLLGTDAVSNNGTILSYSGGEESFCGALTFTPSIELMNLGFSPISSATIDIIATPGGLLNSQNWTGSINSGETSTIQFDPVTITESTNLTVQIVEINGEPDEYQFNNMISTAYVGTSTESSNWTMSLQLDDYGWEVYWQLTNSANDVIASGGNENVGPSGGGLQVSGIGNPGAYDANELVEETIILPSGDSDCYTFTLVDDYGDGLVDGGGGHLILTDEFSTEIISTNLDVTRFTVMDNLVYVDLASSLSELEAISNLTLFPNPAQESLHIAFDLSHGSPLEISIFDALGQLVKTVNTEVFNAGPHQRSIDVSELNSGLYNIVFANENRTMNARFTVTKD